MAENKTFKYSIVTPQVSYLERKAESIVVPGWNGEMGILYNHAPMVAKLSAGEMRITADKKTDCYFINGGFLQVNHNNISVITTEAVPVSELDVDAAREALEEARNRKTHTAEQNDAKREAVRAAKSRLKLAEGRSSTH